MKLISLVFCIPVFAQSGSNQAGFNQAGWTMSGSAKAAAVGFSFETRLEPASPRIEGLGLVGVIAGNPSAHRYTATAFITSTSAMTSRSTLFPRPVPIC